MSTTPVSVASQGPQGTSGQQNPYRDAFQDIDMGDFIKLLVTELSSQDPMEPMDNAQILQQISQIREIASTDQLTGSLDAIKMGQNMATAAGLIDRTIEALTDANKHVFGKVDKVTIEQGIPKLHIGEHTVDMRNVAGIAATVDDLGMIELAVGTAADAASLIGHSVNATTDDQQPVTGKVDSVTVENGIPLLHVGERVLQMRNITGFNADADEPEADATDEQGDDTTA